MTLSNITIIKTIELIGGTRPMVKYKVNLKFKDASISLNEIITEVLKIELQKKLNMTCNYLDRELPCNHTHYSQMEGSSN